MAAARSALIVATASYTDPKLQQLRAPSSDAEALAVVLRNPQIGGFDVRTLIDEPTHHINLAVEEFFADRHPDDLLLVHFSCHGVKDEEGELYLAARDTQLRRLGATAVAADFVNRRMGRSRCRRIVLLLDCCYAGAFERGMTARAGAGVEIEAQFGGRGRAVITASSAMEYAFEGGALTDAQEAPASVFTGALVTGLSTGEADRDQDGLIALDELYDYVYDAVRAATPHQTPSKWTFGVQGDLYIARRARPITKPAPLPTELHDATESPFASIRMAAVQELARLLHGRHAGLALAARKTLERLADDDSRAVSTAATAALGSEPTNPTTPPPLLITTGEEADIDTPPATAEQDPATTTTTDAAEPHMPERRTTAALSSSDAQSTDPTPAAGDQAPTEPETAARRAASTTPTVPGDTRTAETTPLSEPPTAAWAERSLLVAGALALAGAVLSLLSLFPSYVEGFRLLDAASNTWTTLIRTAAAAIAGILLLAPATRRLIGPGFLLGGTATALSSVLNGIQLEASRYYGAPGGGLWLDVAGGAVLELATLIAAVAVARSGSVRLDHQPGPLSWLVALAGVVGSVALYLGQQTAEWFVPEVHMGAMVWTSIVALVVPAVAAMALPHRFTIAVLVGWLGTGLSILTFISLTGVEVFAATLVVLAAATLLLLHADRRPHPST